MLTRQAIAELIRHEIARLRPDMLPSEIDDGASLTETLSLDSFDLEALFAFLRNHVGDAELTPWFVRASRQGSDRLGDLIDFLFLAQQSSGGKP